MGSKRVHTKPPNGTSSKPFTLCVFCGSSEGKDPRFRDAAKALADIMAKRSWSLVYGGGTMGLMGVLAGNVVASQGSDAVHGIIPRALLLGGPPPAPEEFGRTTVVDNMHERKRMMAEEADAFVALPGGFGMLEELLEMTTWSQLGIHAKPVVVLNASGFFDGVFEWMQTAIKSGFIPDVQGGLIGQARTVEELETLVTAREPVEGRYTFLAWTGKKDEETAEGEDLGSRNDLVSP
ncbi:hypothetical protein J4E80_004112 [Alternaria sp. BMP 0032]|nr:hypothetical protein J4E80_004112 [Alternaria sp. BMP 0032]